MTITEGLKRAIGQHFVVGFHGNTESPSEEIVRLIRDYHVGNIIVFKRNISGLEQLRQLIVNLQLLAKDAGHERPILFGIDQENGLVSAFSSTSSKVAGTQFPGAMALAATGSTELARQVSKATADELNAIGINWVYSPVADVNTDPRNPVIGVRSFGDDPYKVSEYAQAVSNGLAEGKVAPCAKHFPGHGDTHVDSHLGLPIIKKTKDDLDSTELVPFKALVSSEHDIASIMTAHISLPDAFGHDMPASLSPETIKILRDEYRYNGIVVTDCLEMEAVVKYCGTPSGAVKALHAGADIAMICHRFDRQSGAIELAYKEMEAATFIVAEWEASSKRIANLKDQFVGNWSDVFNRCVSKEALADMFKEHALLSHSAYAASTTLVCDAKNVLPLKHVPANNTVLLFTPKPESVNLAVDDPTEEGILLTSDNLVRNTAGPSYNAFAKSIGKRCVSAHHIVYHTDSDLEDLLASIKGAAAVIFVMRSADRSVWQQKTLAAVSEVTRDGKIPLVLISSYTPYDLLGTGSRYSDLTHICTYEFTPQALESAAAVIFGEEMAQGILPVELDSA